MPPNDKLLTIAIPTFNRARFLKLCLDELCPQVQPLVDIVEVIVSDNASTDTTAAVVADKIASGTPIRYVRNPDNIGSDRNIAQCFNLASSRYVFIFGDDDIILPGSLAAIVNALQQRAYGVLFVRAFGYDHDYRRERPWLARPALRALAPAPFLIATNVDVTFISSNVINKSLIADIYAEQFLGTRLVQTYLILEAVARAESSAILDGYLIACKRHNSGGYDPFSVFSADLDAAFKRYLGRVLDSVALTRIHNRILLHFFPYYILLALRKRSPPRHEIDATLRRSFADNLVFRRLIAPLLKLPRALAIGTCGMLVVYSRIRRGELPRLIQFAYHRLQHRLRNG